MRGWLVVSVLALAGCGEHLGWNPNYRFNATDYGQYLTAREASLTGVRPASQTIPVALPVKAPTATDIAGQTPVPAPASMSAAAPRRAARAPQADRASPPATAGGRYPGSTPVLVRYAIEAGHAPGARVHPRPQQPAPASRLAAACAAHASADAAQIAFLAAGGPRLDPRGMDPDGDGFVCGWDPAPFRQPQL